MIFQGVCWGGKVVPNSHLREKFTEVPVVKLFSVVSDYYLWYSEPAYYRLPNEVAYVALGDYC